MRSTLAVTTILGAAEAADGGFFLGNAYRCGVSTKRVARAGGMIHALIIAVAYIRSRKQLRVLVLPRSFWRALLPNLDGDALIRPVRWGFRNSTGSSGHSEHEHCRERMVIVSARSSRPTPKQQPCLLRQEFLPERPPLITVGFRELGAEQEDLGGVIDPYQNDDERARSAVG
jgi:hypothetical protein